LTITIHNFTMQSTPASVDMTTQHMFVEYDLMGLPYDELETPSKPLPLPGHSCNFESTHCEFILHSSIALEYTKFLWECMCFVAILAQTISICIVSGGIKM